MSRTEKNFEKEIEEILNNKNVKWQKEIQLNKSQSDS